MRSRSTSNPASSPSPSATEGVRQWTATYNSRSTKSDARTQAGPSSRRSRSRRSVSEVGTVPHHDDPRAADLRATRPAGCEHYGAGALSTVELLAIIFGSDNLEDPAALLADNERLFGLAQLPWAELVAVKGIGPTRAARIKAAFEIGRRLQVAMPEEKPKIKSPADAANLLMMEMMALEQEHLKVVILDTQNHVLKIHTAYIGSLNTAVVRPCELFREAIRLNAAAIIVLHNHPSGSTRPLRRRRLRHTPDRGGRQVARHRLSSITWSSVESLGFAQGKRARFLMATSTRHPSGQPRHLQPNPRRPGTGCAPTIS